MLCILIIHLCVIKSKELSDDTKYLFSLEAAACCGSSVQSSLLHVFWVFTVQCAWLSHDAGILQTGILCIIQEIAAVISKQKKKALLNQKVQPYWFGWVSCKDINVTIEQSHAFCSRLCHRTAEGAQCWVRPAAHCGQICVQLLPPPDPLTPGRRTAWETYGKSFILKVLSLMAKINLALFYKASNPFQISWQH